MASHLVQTLYNGIFKKTSTFTAFILVSAIFIDRGADFACEQIWQTVNRGKLWKDVKKQLDLK